jgi:hypothetical protein
MALTVNATAVPSLSLQEAAVPIAAATDLIFSVILPDKSLAPAFTLGCNISSSISAAVNAGGNITGRVGDATLRLAAVASSFGRLGPVVLSLLQACTTISPSRVASRSLFWLLVTSDQRLTDSTSPSYRIRWSLWSTG